MKSIGPSEIVVASYMQRWLAAALHTAAKLGLADRLAGEPRHVQDLSRALDVDADALFRIMRALASRGIFRQQGRGVFLNTDLSSALMTGAPGGARQLIQAMSETGVGPVCTEYDLALNGDRSLDAARANRFGMGAGQSQGADGYHRAMTALASTQVAAVVEAIDFSVFTRIADLGGGEGMLLASILNRHPHPRGVLVDFATVVQGSPAVLAAAGVRERCETRGGDLLEVVPDDCDAYLLKNVLHGYCDAECERILARVRERAPANATLLIIEMIMPDGIGSAVQAAFDLYLLSGGGAGRVRSEAEFAFLLQRGGWLLKRIVGTRGLASVVEARLANEAAE